MFVKQGGQYTVYLWGRRVRKVPHSPRRAQFIFRLRWANGQNKEEIRKQALESVENGRRSAKAMEDLSKRYPEVYRYLCKPRFSRSGSYSQQRVKTLEEVFARQDHAANVRVLEAYAAALIQEWRYGFFETEFDLTENSGFDADGNLVLLDFGDIALDKTEVERIIREKRWLLDWSYTNSLPKDLRKPFARIMADTLTLANLKRHWGAALQPSLSEQS